MKQKNWLIAGIIVAGVAMLLSFTSTNNSYSDINLSNIEALSSGEMQGYCNGTGSVDCPTSSTKVQSINYF